MLQATPFVTAPVWPIPADGPDLQVIVWAQMKTITNQEALLHAYQGVLNNAQTTTPATGTGSSSPNPGTSVTMSNVVGSILIGATVTGTGLPTGVTVTAQTAGTISGNGTYTVSAPISAVGLTLTFTPGGGAVSWPSSTNSDDLMMIVQDQTAIIRTQTAMLQQYQDLLNVSQTQPPASGP